MCTQSIYHIKMAPKECPKRWNIWLNLVFSIITPKLPLFPSRLDQRPSPPIPTMATAPRLESAIRSPATRPLRPEARGRQWMCESGADAVGCDDIEFLDLIHWQERNRLWQRRVLNIRPIYVPYVTSLQKLLRVQNYFFIEMFVCLIWVRKF